MRKSFAAILVTGTVVAGTLVPATAAFAASHDQYVKALLGTSTVSVNGTSVASNVPKLVYGGTTFIQLYTLEQVLKGMGITPSWNGQTFDANTNSTSSGAPAHTSIKLQNLNKALNGAGATVINGNAINKGLMKHSFTIMATFYNSSGNVIGVEVGSVYNLPPGQSTPFQTLPTGNYSQAASYKVTVQNVM